MASAIRITAMRPYLVLLSVSVIRWVPLLDDGDGVDHQGIGVAHGRHELRNRFHVGRHAGVIQTQRIGQGGGGFEQRREAKSRLTPFSVWAPR